MTADNQFSHNIDAALARIADPLQPFLIADAKLLADHLAPKAKTSLQLPLISTLDLRPNASKAPRLIVKHRVFPASAYHEGEIRIATLSNNAVVTPLYRFRYSETDNRQHFWLTSDLENDEGKKAYPPTVKIPERRFLGPNAHEILATLMGKPYIAQRLRLIDHGLTPA